MANRTIEIILRAKNAMATGLQAAGNALKKFGSAAVSIGKAAGVAVLGAGAAIFKMAKTAVEAYAESEKAWGGLTAALTANGEAGEALLPTLQKVATAIQDETGISDESTASMMARLRMLGVQTGQLEEAAKATIALKSVGMENETAQRAVALAMQGNYSLLQRYVPALRDATSEEEKAVIVKDLFTRGYENQKNQLNTLAGQYGLLKERIGDAFETIGQAMASNETVMKGLEWASNKVKEIGAAIQGWIAEGGVEIAVSRFKALFASIEYGFKIASANVALFFAYIRDNSSFKYVSGIITTFVDLAVKDFKWLAEIAKQAWSLITGKGANWSEASARFDAIVVAQRRFLKSLIDFNTEETNYVRQAKMAQINIQLDYADRIKAIDSEMHAAILRNQQKRIEMDQKRSASRIAIVTDAVVAEETAETELVENIGTLADEREKKHEETLDKIVESEQAHIQEVVAINEGGADAVGTVWAEAGANIAASTEKMRNNTGLQLGGLFANEQSWSGRRFQIVEKVMPEAQSIYHYGEGYGFDFMNKATFGESAIEATLSNKICNELVNIGDKLDQVLRMG